MAITATQQTGTDSPARPRRITRHLRRRPIQLLLAGVLTFLVASAVPPAIIAQMRPIPDGLNITFHSRPFDSLSLVAPLNGAAGIPEPNRDRPECREGSYPAVPYSCFVVEAPISRTHVVTTSAAPESGEVDVDSLMQIAVGDQVMAEITDGQRLDRRSAYPVSDPVSYLTLSVPALDSGITREPFVREGLQYFFPFPTGQESYLFFDQAVSDPLLLDYVGETEHNGVDTYEFHHTFTALPAGTDPEIALELGDEAIFALGAVGDQGLGSPWYAVDRTVWVEPQTGTIVDLLTEVHIYFAPDSAAAETRAFSPSRDHTIFHSVIEWDDTTLQRQHDYAAEQVSTLRVLQVLAVALKTIALILVAAGVVLLLRERAGR